MRRFGIPAAFAIVLGVQILPSVTLAWQQMQRLEDGLPVRLAVTTRDPRDLFRGEYSVLSYEIGTLQGLEAGSIPADCRQQGKSRCSLSRQLPVYVRLAADADGISRASEVLFEPPAAGGPFIAGRLTFGNLVPRGAELAGRPTARASGSTAPALCEHEACLSGTVTYGIEKWYGPQGVPGQFDRQPSRDVLVDVRIGADGAALIDGVRVGGIPFAGKARLW